MINRQPCELAPAATLADALARVQARPPYAVAVNLQFVPKERYAETPLRDGDEIEVIAPVTGG